ncbi:hypothetical protein GP486_006407 [Trichoglossum hirsutum]|uniref:Major facilitator superfamily (MFS) profile domain-containing protein n=1 Tax=Trichoglossum hirsutum TaxID=265104 RepID=A0A9P8L7F1_9PEZI|nr:hypothetical protein GP486_006407 [Trichoglossum hirsutum]
MEVIYRVYRELHYDLFLYGFIVPILPYMLEERVKVGHDSAQAVTSNLLALYSVSQVIFSPIIGVIADRNEKRKMPLLVALYSGLGSTILLAVATNGLSGIVIWIVGFAVLVDTVGAANMGKTLGVVSVFMNSASFAGPMVGGLLLEAIGYYPTWSVPIAVLLIDIAMRILMVEDPRNRASQKIAGTSCDERSCFGTRTTCKSECPDSDEPPPESIQEPDRRQPAASDFSRLTVTEEVIVTYTPNPHYPPSSSTPSEGHSIDETSPLIAAHKPAGAVQPVTTELTTIQFYMLLCRHRRILASLFLLMTYAILVSAFDATLPLHVKEAFGWGSSGSGAMFLALQAPGVVFGPLVGWLRDRVGVRYPTGIGFVLLAPLLFGLGMPANPLFPWLSLSAGKTLYLSVMIGVGVVINLVVGAGTVDCTVVIDEMEAQQPGIFGPNGAFSRLYSVSSLIYMVGNFIGPEISGYLRDTVGYGYMNLALGTTRSLSPSWAFGY